MKPATDVIVHPACGHLAQREQRHFERLFGRIALGIACVKACQEIERHRSRKFRRSTKPAFLRIVTSVNLFVSGI